jgi:hypothetical protein
MRKNVKLRAWSNANRNEDAAASSMTSYHYNGQEQSQAPS